VPTFHAVASNGQAVDVAPGARAHALVVYFYPRDETPGCTIEAEAFRDAHEVYETSGIDVVGVSTDTDEAHRGFSSNHSLPFALVADPEGRIAAAFGVRVNNGYAQRTTFVVDRQGHIARVFSPVQPRGHADEVIAAVRALGPSA
jgi:peroxiredoxin Q/BCP